MQFKEFGKVPLCNHRADRGIYIHGFCLPLCARCTGLLLGSTAASIAEHMVYRYYGGKETGAGVHAGPVSGLKRQGRSQSKRLEKLQAKPSVSLAPAAALLLPAAADGLAEYAAGRESTNTRRLLTGLAAGAGCVLAETAAKEMINHIV